MSRPKITKITVEIDGKAPIVLEGKNLPSAIFCDNQAVKWLGAFYDIHGDKTLSKAKAEANFGLTKAAAVMGANSDVNITSTVVNDIWITPDDKGELPPMLAKLPDCTFA
jgi:hypothetical protein